MTGREFDDMVVEAAAIAAWQSDYPYREVEAWPLAAGAEMYRNVARAVLTAAADALEGAILAPVAALADEWDSAHEAYTAQLLVTALRAVIADPDSVAKHNAAIRDAVLSELVADMASDDAPDVRLVGNWVQGWAHADSDRASEPTQPARVADCGQDAICADNPWALCDRHKAEFMAWRDRKEAGDRG